MAGHLLQGSARPEGPGSFAWCFWTTAAVHLVVAVLVALCLLIGLGLAVPTFAGVEVVTLVVAAVWAARGRRRGALGVVAGALAVLAALVAVFYALVVPSVGDPT